MNNTIIDADEQSLILIAKNMTTTIQDLQSVCNRTKNNVNDAESLMQDESGKKACDIIMTNIEEILGILPQMEAFAKACKDTAKYMEDAKSVMKGI